MVKEGGVVVEWWWWEGGVVVVERWSGGGGPSHLLYRDTEEVGGLDTKCCCLAVLEWTSVGR